MRPVASSAKDKGSGVAVGVMLTSDRKAVWSPGFSPMNSRVWLPVVSIVNEAVSSVNGVKLVKAQVPITPPSINAATVWSPSSPPPLSYREPK